MKIPTDIAVLLEKCLPTAGNPHVLLGQTLKESSFAKGFVLGCKKIISSGTMDDSSLTAKWSKVNYLLQQTVTCDCSPRNYLPQALK